MTAYCLFDNVEVTDPAAMAEYASKVGEMVRRHGGRYLALGGTVETIEGSPTLHGPVPIEFPDLAAAHAWYDSPEYGPLRDLRQAAVQTTAVFFETPESVLDRTRA
jgi:uncharacterized protein (DUF1330 family)